MPGWEQPPLLEEQTGFRGTIGEQRTRAIRFADGEKARNDAIVRTCSP